MVVELQTTRRTTLDARWLPPQGAARLQCSVVRAKRQSWSGSPPRSEAEARARLIEAALACAQAKGLRRATLTDIAREAGVTRPTVYNHFDDRHAIFQAAFTEAALRLAVGAREAMLAHDTPGARAVEAVLYFVLELPRDPCLRRPRR